MIPNNDYDMFLDANCYAVRVAVVLFYRSRSRFIAETRFLLATR